MRLRWHWGTGIALVYTAFATGTAAFVVFALRQPVDLVTRDYYAQALAHDARAEAANRAASLGSALTVSVLGAGSALEVAWPGAARRPALSGTITMYRPSDSAADRVFTVAPDAAGRQRIPLAGVQSGRWRIQLAWTSAGVDYYAERDILVRR
jgi:hypothetical protein